MAKIALSGSNPSLRPPTSRSAHLLPAPCLRAVLPVLLPIPSTGTLPAGGPRPRSCTRGLWTIPGWDLGYRRGESRALAPPRAPTAHETAAPGLAVVPARGCPSRVGAGIQPAASAKCHGPVTVSLRLPL
uniref:Uncharacterized protein n=1 Tax=Aquila chrysaetos chrysaetos TaxID=223781 RepID=A0A663EYE7_AQUCH